MMVAAAAKIVLTTFKLL